MKTIDHTHATETLPFFATDIRKKRILAIDDNIDNLELSKMVLENYNYDVSTALSAELALSMLTEMDCPDLILLDMHMSGMSGCEFLLALEEKQDKIFNQVPVVFFSAMDKAPVSKAAGFIRKPYHLNDFLSAIREHILGKNALTF